MTYLNSLNRAMARWCPHPIAWRTYVRIEMIRPNAMVDKSLDFPKLGNVDVAMPWLETPLLIEELRYARYAGDDAS